MPKRPVTEVNESSNSLRESNSHQLTDQEGFPGLQLNPGTEVDAQLGGQDTHAVAFEGQGLEPWQCKEWKSFLASPALPQRLVHLL